MALVLYIYKRPLSVKLAATNVPLVFKGIHIRLSMLEESHTRRKNFTVMRYTTSMHAKSITFLNLKVAYCYKSIDFSSDLLADLNPNP